MARRLVIIKGIMWVTQKRTQTTNMAKAFLPSSVSPSVLGKYNIMINTKMAKNMMKYR
ncbi:MAG: hypothetical protein SCALA701_07830 [Candidatus Scalindua sp.]|nr:MAG: hypothetical protein SCALA701_07830 [Candidatus Scalindua sp.]